MVEYEYRVLDFPAQMPRSDVRRLLTDHAEYGQWELHRTLIRFGGARRAWLRRKIIRARRRTD